GLCDSATKRRAVTRPPSHSNHHRRKREGNPESDTLDSQRNTEASRSEMTLLELMFRNHRFFAIGNTSCCREPLLRANNSRRVSRRCGTTWRVVVKIVGEFVRKEGEFSGKLRRPPKTRNPRLARVSAYLCGFDGEPSERIRSQTLYPAELRAHPAESRG